MYMDNIYIINLEDKQYYLEVNIMKIKTIILLLMVIFVIGCKDKVEVQEAPVVEEPQAIEPAMQDEVDQEGSTFKGEAVEAKQIANQEDIGLDSALAVDTTENLEKLSNFGCAYDEESGLRMLSLTLTNTNEEESYMISPKGVAPGFNTYFIARGIVVKDPGCSVEELAPGESTTCSTIGPESVSYTNQIGANRVIVQTPGNDGSSSKEAIIIECGA